MTAAEKAKWQQVNALSLQTFTHFNDFKAGLSSAGAEAVSMPKQMPVPQVQTVEKIVEVPVPDVQTVEKIVEEPQHATNFDIEAYWEERRMMLRKRRMDEEDEMDEEHQA